MNKKIKIIKTELQNRGIWKSYKKKFKHRQIKFLTSKILLTYNPKLPLKVLLEKEIDFYNCQRKNKNMFVELFSDFEKLTKTNADWKSFSIFIFFIFQTSTYWKDNKNGIKNIFNEDHIKANEEKRKHYTKWLNSLNYTKEITNNKVIEILKLVF